MTSDFIRLVSEADFEYEVIAFSRQTPVVVDFWAEWCGPCKQIAPIVEEIAQNYDSKIKVGKVDVDANGPLAAKYGIASIPTMIVFKGGQPVQQVIGYKPKKELQKVLDGVLEG